jgi:hypothetical protein
MPSKLHNPNPAGRSGKPIGAANIKTDQLVEGMLKIKPAKAKRIVTSKPGKQSAKG